MSARFRVDSGDRKDLFAAWMATEEECLDEMKVDPQEGLTSEEAEARLKKYGANELEEEEGSTLMEKIIEQFDDPLVKILLASAVISFVLAYFEEHKDGDNSLTAFVEPFVILLILIINAFVGVWQENNAEDALDALKQMQADTVACVRDGKLVSDLPASQLVPGDIVDLNVGDKVPADARVIKLHTATFRLEQMSLTGESVAVTKVADELVAEDAVIQQKVNMVFSSTAVANGKATCLIVATGMNTEIGQLQQDLNTDAKRKKLAAELDEIKKQPEAKQDVKRVADLESQLDELDDKTPLGKKLEDFGELLTQIIGYVCLLVWIINYKNFLDVGLLLSGDVSNAFNFGKCTYYFKIAVALAVAAIPEGLPAVITTCLALGTRKMAKKNALVRKLPSVETLGCTTVICSDKTGTLTTNQMSVTRYVAMGEGGDVASHAVTGATYSPVGGEVVGLAGERLTPQQVAIAKTCALCNESKIEYRLEQRKDGRVTQRAGYDRTGAPTEAALRVLAEKFGVPDLERQDGIEEQRAAGSSDADKVASAQGCSDYWADMHYKIATLEFSRDRKSMSVICRPAGAGAPAGADGAAAAQGVQTRQRRRAASPAAGSGNVLFVKGAPEGLLRRSTHVMLPSGKVVKMTAAMERQLEDAILEMSDAALRCLGLAVREDLSDFGLEDYDGSSHHRAHDLLQNVDGYADVESRLTFLGVAGMQDPARPSVPDALRRCDDAGIRVMVITGDNKHTAEAICRDIGLFGKDEDLSGKSFEGRTFVEMSKEEQLEVLGSHGGRVFSRAEPAHKSKIISLLKGQGEVAAMTGDGVNDAPALKLASIGVAMGIAGTEVAKQAADMVLADDNFATIVHAVEEGRSIYNNMKAFIRYMISSNIGEVASIFLTAVLGMPEGLIPVQLLWVNLVTDGPPATALGFNPADKDIMTRPPRPPNDKLINGWTFFRYMVIGIYVGVATVGVFAVWYTQDAFMGIDLSEDGHHAVTYHQLTNWESCHDHAAEWFKGVKEVGYTAGHKTFTYSGDTLCDYFTEGKDKASTLSLSVLVTIEMFNALNALSEDGSLLQMPPWVNPWLLVAMFISFALHFLILYVDFFADIFSIVPLSVNEWLLVLAFSFPVILIDEVLKFVGRQMNASERAARAAAKASKQ